MPAKRPARYIALLRAINVGGHTVRMEQLRALFTQLGFDNVTTFIASGNVIFDTTAAERARLERRIEQHLRTSLGYDVATFLRSPRELAAIAQHEPFAAADRDGNMLYVAFLAERAHPDAAQQLAPFRSDADDFAVHEREVYWLCRKKLSESRFSGAVLEKALGVRATLRNSTTVGRLAALYGAAD